MQCIEPEVEEVEIPDSDDDDDLDEARDGEQDVEGPAAAGEKLRNGYLKGTTGALRLISFCVHV